MHGDDVILSYMNRLSPTLQKYKDNATIIEVGSTRDAGSTYKLSLICEKYNFRFTTIDPSEESNRDAIKVLNQFNKPDLYNAVLETGESYMEKYNTKDIVLSYLDGMDIVTDWPHKQYVIDFYFSIGIDLMKDGNRISAEQHLETAKSINKNTVNGGFMCFDDTWQEYDNVTWMGKGKTAVPHLLENGWVLVNEVRPPNPQRLFPIDKNDLSKGNKPYLCNHGILLQKTVD